jgi:hypothetical protein
MKRPEKFKKTFTVYEGVNKSSEYERYFYACNDIDPLLDELEALRNRQTFPTWEEFQEWLVGKTKPSYETIYNYFKSRIQPLEIGREYEFQHLPEQGWYRKKLLGFKTTDSPLIWQSIRPIQADPIQDPIQNVIDILKSIREWSIGDNEYEALQDAIKILEESK